MAVSPTSSSSASSALRITGMATGMDTDATVKSLMAPERAKVDKLYQKKQSAQWKQEAYRDITNDLRALKDEYFNVIKPATNALSQNNYRKFTTSSSDSSIVTAGVSDPSIATAGTNSIKIDAIATAGTSTSNNISKPLEGTANIDLAAVQALSGKTLKINLDGLTKEITLGDFSALTGVDDFKGALKADMQTKIDTAFGEISPGVKKINVDVNLSNHLTFTPGTGLTKITLNDGTSSSGLSIMGYSNGDSNRISLSTTLATIAQNAGSGLTLTADNKYNTTINGRTYQFTSTDTLSTMLSKINSDTAGEVSARYDERQDKIILTAKQLGNGTNITVNDTAGSFLSTFAYAAGTDSKIYLNGSVTPIISSSNSVSVNGVTYNLQKTTGGATQNITLSKDTDATYNIIKNFFEKYNAFIDKVNTKLTEKYDRNYQPLTSDQKSSMNETDIKNWETKAKTGLLRNDPTLQRLLNDLRSSFSDPITGISGNSADIGVAPGAYYEKGKITIDEIKLKDAIANSPDKVVNFMIKGSTTEPTYLRSMTPDRLRTRYNEEGIMNRISDALENNISTISNSNSKKGYLIAIAGVQNDSSEFKNDIYDQIKEYDKSISNQNEKLSDKESAYYRKFANLEQAISKMNNQSGWLSKQLGG